MNPATLNQLAKDAASELMEQFGHKFDGDYEILNTLENQQMVRDWYEEICPGEDNDAPFHIVRNGKYILTSGLIAQWALKKVLGLDTK